MFIGSRGSVAETQAVQHALWADIWSPGAIQVNRLTSQMPFDLEEEEEEGDDEEDKSLGEAGAVAKVHKLVDLLAKGRDKSREWRDGYLKVRVCM